MMAGPKVVEKDGKEPEGKKPEAGILRPLGHRGGVAPQPPHFRAFHDEGVAPPARGRPAGSPWEGPGHGKAFQALREIRRHQARSDELLQSVGLVKGQEVTADKLRALIANAGKMDGGREDAAAAIMNLALLITARDGKINAALREVQKDAGLPAEIAEAIGTSLDFLERDRAAIEGK